MVETKIDRKALTEVYHVINSLNINEYKRIPVNIITAIEENMDKNYEVDFEILEKQMLPDTKKILATIYTYFLANKEEKNIINQLIESEKKYKTKDIFKYNKVEITNSKEIENINLPSNIIEYKENFIKKIIYKIKHFFKIT